MSNLTDSLELILSWLQENKPSFASSLQPGLSRAEIQDMLGDEFTLRLPNDFYELYQWRNGIPYGDEEVISFFPGFAFNSLEYALDQHADIVDGSSMNFMERSFNLGKYTANNTDLLPIFTRDSEEHLYILGSEKQLNPAPIVHYYAEFGGPTIAYESITDMMQIISECYREGAYYFSEVGDFEVDEARAKIVRQLHRNA